MSRSCTTKHPSIRRSSALVAPIFALAVFHGVAAPAFAGQLKIDGGNKALEIQRQIAVGEFAPVAHGLTPCVASWKLPFYEERRLDGPWMGRFVVNQTVPENWTLVVRSLDGEVLEWRMPITAVHAPGDWWTSPVFPSGRVSITLESQAPGSLCPSVLFKDEVRRSHHAQQRGQVGNKDDRWVEASPELAALPDAAKIKSWAAAVTRMEVISPTGLMVPCTGYFISENLLMTAAHCVSTDVGAARAVVYLDSQTITGSGVRLVMAQGQDLDFSLLWIVGAHATAILALSDGAPQPLAVWQAGEALKKVSIIQCSMLTASADLLEHSCDTIGGSSGSAVQDLATGAVVGLHVAGCTTSNATAACRNGATPANAIRRRILQYSADLKKADAAAAAQLVAVGLLPQD